MELKHTIQLIRVFDAEIAEIEAEIDRIMTEIDSPITTIPGIGNRMGAMILAEIGDISRFDSPDKLLAYSGISPSTYQSGKLSNAYAHMEKRGSRYLRYALFNAARYVCNWDDSSAAYLARKRAEGKHYYVAVSHAVKKLVRVIFSLLKTGEVTTRESCPVLSEPEPRLPTSRRSVPLTNRSIQILSFLARAKLSLVSCSPVALASFSPSI